MKKKKGFPKDDLSFYVIELNQLLSELNHAARETFQPDVKQITRIAEAIETSASSIKKAVSS